MSEEPIEPFFTGDEPGPRFGTQDVATIVARVTGIPDKLAHARVAYYAKARLIHVRVGRRGAEPNSFALKDVAAAILLSNFADCGIGDKEVMQAVSLQIYSKRNRDQIAYFEGAPIDVAMWGTFNGQHWCLRLDFYRHGQTNERRSYTAFSNLESGPVPSDSELRPGGDWIPTGSLVSVASDHLMSLRRYAFPEGN